MKRVGFFWLTLACLVGAGQVAPAFARENCATRFDWLLAGFRKRTPPPEFHNIPIEQALPALAAHGVEAKPVLLDDRLVLQILPKGKSRLGKLAASLQRRFDYLLIYDPENNRKLGAVAFENSDLRVIGISSEAALTGKVDQSLVHELRHAYQSYLKSRAENEDLGEVLLSGWIQAGHTPIPVDGYEKGFRFDEMSSFLTNMFGLSAGLRRSQSALDSLASQVDTISADINALIRERNDLLRELGQPASRWWTEEEPKFLHRVFGLSPKPAASGPEALLDEVGRDLLQRRRDLRKAEAKLEAARAKRTGRTVSESLPPETVVVLDKMEQFAKEIRAVTSGLVEEVKYFDVKNFHVSWHPKDNDGEPLLLEYAGPNDRPLGLFLHRRNGPLALGLSSQLEDAAGVKRHFHFDLHDPGVVDAFNQEAKVWGEWSNYLQAQTKAGRRTLAELTLNDGKLYRSPGFAPAVQRAAWALVAYDIFLKRVLERTTKMRLAVSRNDAKAYLSELRALRREVMLYYYPTHGRPKAQK